MLWNTLNLKKIVLAVHGILMSANTEKTETIEEVVETKSSKKWYYIGAVVAVAVIGGAAYKKFVNKETVTTTEV